MTLCTCVGARKRADASRGARRGTAGVGTSGSVVIIDCPPSPAPGTGLVTPEVVRGLGADSREPHRPAARPWYDLHHLVNRTGRADHPIG
ncbi:hypothetical protein GCM10023199_40040 [Actinomycetospora chibensis]